MNFKEIFGLILIATGIFLIIAQPFSPTGAVIDLSTSSAKVSFVVGILMVIVGFVVMLFDRKINR